MVQEGSLALLWVDENTVLTVMVYGKYDIFHSYGESIRLAEVLMKVGIDHNILF